MAKYINADAFRIDIIRRCDYCGDILKMLEDASTANVRENTQGKWLLTPTAYPYCSQCGWMPEEDEMCHGFYDFCPSCGSYNGDKQHETN